MFGVDLDRIEHQIEFVGRVDFTRHAIELVRCDEKGFGEIIEAINPLGVMVFHDEHRALEAVRPGEQGQMIGAEVKHG